MAHELEFIDGKASCYLYKSGAWHGEGVVSDSNLDFTSIRKIAHHDFKVEKKDLRISGTGKKLQIAKNHCATVRMDNLTELGIVGKNYGLVQYDDVYNFLADLGKVMPELIIESALSLGNGERFAIGCRLGDEFIFGEDKTYPYLYINGSFDGSLLHSVLPTSTRIVCRNTQRMAIEAKDKNAFFMKHSSGIMDRIEKAKGVILAAKTTWEKQKAIYAAMTQISADEKMVEDLIAEVYGSITPDSSKNAKTKNEKIRSEVFKLWNGDTCKGISGANLFTGFNALTEHIDFYSVIHGAGIDTSGMTKEEKEDHEIAMNQARFDSNVLGNNANKKSDLFDYCVEKYDLENVI